MGIFSKKRNGDYFVEMVQTLAEIKADNKHLTASFNEHNEAEYERRKIDREWQKSIDVKLSKPIECPQKDDINKLMSDKKISEGRILGMKSVYIVFAAVMFVIGGILGILWRLGLL